MRDDPPQTGTGSPAAPAQAKFWELHRRHPATNIDHLVGFLPVPHSTGADAANAALAALLARHESLRTSLRTSLRHGGGLRQVLDSRATARVEEFDATEDRRAAGAEAAGRFAGRPFALDRAPLLRACLVRTGAGSDVLMVVVSHAVADGWSLEVIREELGALIRGGETCTLPEARPYREVLAEAVAPHRPAARRNRTYWLRQLTGMDPHLDLPVRGGDRIRREVTRDVSRSVAVGGAPPAPGAALGTVPLLTALAVALRDYAPRGEVVVGLLHANRTRRSRGVVGNLVNGLPIRIGFGDDPTVGALLSRVGDAVLAARSHGAYPMESIADELGFGPGVLDSRRPLWEVAANFWPSPAPPRRADDPAVAATVRLISDAIPYRPKEQWDGKVCELHAVQLPAHLALRLNHIRELDAAVAEGILRDVDRLIGRLPGALDTRVSHVPLGGG